MVDWCTLQTTGSGNLWFDECEFWSQSGGGAGPCLMQHTGPATWTKCKFKGLTGNPLGSIGYDFSSGGRSTFQLCENAEFGVTFNSTITGPLFVRDGQWLAAVTVAKNGTTLENNNFAAEPTLSGTLLATSRNKVADSLTKAVTLSSSQNNYNWPTVCDTVLFDTTGTNNYSITGIVPRAKGTTVKAVNVDSADNVTLSHGSASSSAANKININAGSDLVLGPLDGKEIISTENTTMGWSEN